MCSVKNFLLAVILVFCLLSSALAEDNWWSGFSDEVRGSIGAGVLVSEKPYTGVDTETYVIPFARLYYRGLFFEGTRFGYELYKNEDWKFSPILQWRFDGYESGDSSALTGMADRDMTLDGGAQLEYDMGWSVLRFSWVADLLSEHQGHEFEISMAKRYAQAFDIEKLSVIPNIGVSFLSSDLADYYYGVRASEAIGGRPQYNVGSSTNYSAGVNMIYQLDEKWDLMAGFNYTWLDSEIEDSPIVSEDAVYSIMAGLAYKF